VARSIKSIAYTKRRFNSDALTLQTPISLYRNSKPYTRWWWFSGQIRKKDIVDQLRWLKKNGFGGVEVAWIYPLPDSRPGPRWLSREWTKLVAFTKRRSTGLGLGCDFTFGTLWPFGGSIVRRPDAALTYRGVSAQRLDRSWEIPHSSPGYILNHLSRKALGNYSRKMATALKPALRGKSSALFCDSWEVETRGLWTRGFDKRFRRVYGYDVRGYMPKIDSYPDVRYDYRKLLANYVLNEFYRPFTKICHRLNAISRVQCHGAPTDLIAAYAAVDVPESEAILFDPSFSRFAASAAALSNKTIVSAETFTCLYGWKPYPKPGPYHKMEKVQDLKLLADAMFANGVNFIVWHGMPFNPAGSSNEFYATVHVGPDSAFASCIISFNQYLKRISRMMRRGKVYTDIAVYLPLEEAWMKNKLPVKLQKISSRYYWEHQETKISEELKGFQPLWISSYFLRQADYRQGKLRCGTAKFDMLYIAAKYLANDALRHILRLARRGCPVSLRTIPHQPGHVKSDDYGRMLGELLSLSNVRRSFKGPRSPIPLIQGKEIPEFWVRQIKEKLLIFFAYPMTKSVTYPMPYQRPVKKIYHMPLTINYNGKHRKITLKFKPYRSIMVSISNKGVSLIRR
jgi:hypothetical protein